MKLKMTRYALILMILALTKVQPALAYGCGYPPFKPFPPFGCKDLTPVCVCDDMGNCEWQFVCVPG